MRSREPEVLSQSRSTDALAQTLRIPADLAWFEGHFPGDPILAGVVQLKWAIERAQRIVGAGAQPRAIHQLKFKAPIRPGAVVELALHAAGLGPTVEFSFRSAAGEHSSGRLLYGAS